MSGGAGAGTAWSEVRRKLAKAVRLLRTRRYRRALAFGVAAGDEHTELLAGLAGLAGQELRTVVDVGANKGQFALLALELFPAATVHAFEPLAEPHARLAAWSAGEPRLVRHRLALATASGTVVMQVAARDDSSSLRSITPRQVAQFPGTHRVGEESVAVARLDGVLGPGDLIAPAFLKIDVQGSELDVLRGAGALLDRFDWVYAECSFVELYGGQALAGEVATFLAAAGFTAVASWNPVRVGGQPIQADLLFQRVCNA